MKVEANDLVLTPTGRAAIVLDVREDLGEAIVEWLDTHDRAHFRLKHLRKVNGGAG